MTTEKSDTGTTEPNQAAFDDFAARLDEARADRDSNIQRESDKARGQAMGLGIKLASELVAALIVGGALGYGVDLLTGKSPLFLLIGLALGMAAAFVNVLRLMKKMAAANVADNSDDRTTTETD